MKYLDAVRAINNIFLIAKTPEQRVRDLIAEWDSFELAPDTPDTQRQMKAVLKELDDLKHAHPKLNIVLTRRYISQL